MAALIHDLGDELAPYSHSELAASVLRPYVEDRFKAHPWFDDAVDFCERYDQNCFDSAYDSLPLSYFEPMVREVFSRQPMFDEIASG